MSTVTFRMEKLTNGASPSPGDYRFPFSLFLLSLHFSQASVRQPFPAAMFLEGSVPAADWTLEAAGHSAPPLPLPFQADPKLLCAGNRRIFRKKQEEVTGASQVS